MPQLERWDNLPEGARQHLIERMRDREISVCDLNQLRLWIETRPEVPEGDWYKDFGSSKSAAADRTQKRSYSEVKSPRAKPLIMHDLSGYSFLVAKRLTTASAQP